ncbi:hypothetical protein CHUAL_010515 [Chamberlinius hualienensis]
MGNILIAIVLCFNIFIPGKCQHQEIIQPYTVVNDSGFITYKCEFNLQVDCLWRNNRTGLGNYFATSRYITGNGLDTTDCSISVSELYWASEFQNLQCVGLPIQFKDITVSENSVELSCTFQGRKTCSWSRNHYLVGIGGRYKYTSGHHHEINVNDCSITIDNIIAFIDEGEWICRINPGNGMDENWFPLAAYNLKSSTSFLFMGICPPSSDCFKKILSFYLPIIFIFTGIIIGMAIYMRKITISLRNFKNSQESHLTEFKNEVDGHLKVNGQTETDGYLTINELQHNTIKFNRKNSIESVDEYLMPECSEDQNQFKHHLYEKLNYNRPNSN